MKVHLLSDGRVFDGETAVYEAGDVAWFEEDVLLVTAVDGDTTTAVVHPAAQEMLRTAMSGKAGQEDADHGLMGAMRIHDRTMARGYPAAMAFIVTADLNATTATRAGITAGVAEFDALRDLRDQLEKAQEIVKPRRRRAGGSIVTSTLGHMEGDCECWRCVEDRAIANGTLDQEDEYRARDADPTTCEHPPDAREVTSGADWLCGLCGDEVGTPPAEHLMTNDPDTDVETPHDLF